MARAVAATTGQRIDDMGGHGAIAGHLMVSHRSQHLLHLMSKL
jgi:hypothetical protein